MKVYILIPGIDYEGYFVPFAVYYKKEDAELERKKQEEYGRYDYWGIFELEVL